MEDYRSVTNTTGEPLIETMLVDASSDVTVANFRPPNEKSISAYDLWQLQKAKLKMRQEYLEMWEQTAATTGTGRPVDAIISPAAPYAAPPHGKNTYVLRLFFTFNKRA